MTESDLTEIQQCMLTTETHAGGGGMRPDGKGLPSPRLELHHDDALKVLSGLPAGTANAVITDPPYSSGGMVRGDRIAATHVKYSSSGSSKDSAEYDFTGDNRDQRGFAFWATMWMSEARRVTAQGGMLMCFTDWRQLPTMTDAIQAGGWVWRGIVPWAKPNARPQLGRFTNQAEYVLWASNGPLPTFHKGEAAAFRGWVKAMPPMGSRRVHPTEKPAEVMEHLMGPVKEGGTVLDPFMGSGATGVAALKTGRRFIGCELTSKYFDISTARLEDLALKMETAA